MNPASGSNTGDASGQNGNSENSNDAVNEEVQKYNDLAAVSLASKIPDFWTDQPSLWFMQAEAMLTPQHLSDQIKYNMIITKLGKDVIGQVTDILIKPPDSGKYETLKKRLIQIYEETEIRQIQKLMSEMELGEQKPSQLLRRMKELARNRIGDETLSVLWQGHLPPPVRGVLAVADIKELDKIAATADKIMESSRPFFVAEVSNSNTSSSAGSSGNTSDSMQTEQILKEIAKLHLKINKINNRHGRSRSRNRNQGNNWNRGRSSSSKKTRMSPNSPDWLCFYHFRFREKASKCVEPCNWKNQGN